MGRRLVAKGPGFEQGRARQVAREMGGIAVGVRPSPAGGWIQGGWASQKDEVWVVLTLDQQTVMVDGEDQVL